MLRRAAVAVVLASSCATLASASSKGNASAAPAPNKLALVSVTSPQSLSGAFLGYFASFSPQPPPSGEFGAWTLDGDAALGCSRLPQAPAATGAGAIALLRRGNCTFEEKARQAEAAGATGLLIVSDSDQVPQMGSDNITNESSAIRIPVVGVQKSLGDALITHTLKHPSAPPTLTLAVYVISPWNALIAEMVIICLATFLVVAGACFATADLRVGSPIAPGKREEVVDVSTELAVSFCLVGSGMLVVLFFFMKYLIYFIIFGFCVGGFSCILQMTSALLVYFFPPLKERACTIPWLNERFSRADLLGAIPAAAVVAAWLAFRNEPVGWIFQDIIGAGFLCWMQRTLRLPNIKVATVLLTMMFFFDIFWVFISPVIFQKSVMVTVAKGGGTGEKVPMLLRVPSVGDMLGSERMLGFGDVALPGLLISYLRRHDILSKRHCCSGYFVPSVVGYFLGLCVTIVALTIMKMGQPALLYLVPGTLGTTLVLGCCRGELRELWDGKPKPRGDSVSDSGSEEASDDGEAP